jgi:predicted metalloprotease with PDZ domain
MTRMHLLSRAAIAALLSAPLVASAQAPIRVDVDATDVARRIVRAHLQVPVAGGPVAFSLPKWIPGAHAPTGRVGALGGLSFKADGKVLPWRRDLLDASVFHVAAPASATAVSIDLDFLPPTSTLSNHILNFHWNAVTLYVAGKPDSAIPVLASMKLPAGWQLATALPVESVDGAVTHFRQASLETMIDSPVLAGDHMRKVALTKGEKHRHYLDVAAENEADLPGDPVLLGHFSSLVAQAQKLYGVEHYRDYHFLVNASDHLQGGGIEHHESNDTHLNGAFFRDAQQQYAAGYLLPHEYAHSWCGKFRRPADLATPDAQTPMKTDLLWVYEGLDDYLADLLVTRSGLWTPQQTREYWAAQAAQLDRQLGRTWRPLQDTADAVPDSMTGSAGSWPSWQRGSDYYPEGVLIWLEANQIIREKSRGTKSLDDFARAFFAGQDGVPMVKTYTEADVHAALNAVQPHDWAAFFHERLTSLAPRAPLGGLEKAGWKLVYSAAPNVYIQAAEARRHNFDALYSIGIAGTAAGAIADSLRDGPAFAAGLVPGMTITEVNGQKWSPAALEKAIAASASVPVEISATFAGESRLYRIAYSGGPRYPHLEQVPGTADGLAVLFAPLK